MESKQWIDELSFPMTPIGLSDAYTMVDAKVPGLKTELYLHQRTIVRAMMDLEYKRIFRGTYTVRTNIGLLSEPVGSGKTFDILALILLQNKPKQYRDNIVSHVHGKGIYATIYKKYPKMIDANLIFVGISVLHQWTASIVEYTNLKLFVVDGIARLGQLIDMIESGEVSNYDVILVKNSKVCRTPDNFPADIQQRENICIQAPTIFNVISNLVHVTWKRVIIDDYDTIQLATSSFYINSIFTWFISSTDRRSISRFTNNHKYASTEDALLLCANKLQETTCDRTFKLFRVFNEPAFYTQSIQLAPPKFYKYSVVNTNDRFINAIGNMSDPHARELMQMLNADSIESAAELAGIKSNSVIDIFDKILSDKYKVVQHAIKKLKFIEDAIQSEQYWRPMSEIPEGEPETYTARDLDEFKEIKYHYLGINMFLQNAAEKTQALYDQNMLAIRRVKDNLEIAECPVCMNDLGDPNDLDDVSDCVNFVIFKCCNIILCSECCFGTIFKKKLNGECINCRCELTIRDIIFMKGSDIDYDDLRSGFDDENIDKNIDAVKKVNIVATNVAAATLTSKIDVIMDIVNGHVVPAREQINVLIDNIMYGTIEGSDIEPAVRKTLIFSNYDETLAKIAMKLQVQNISYYNLQGTPKQISDIVSKFKAATDHVVLLINSVKYCNGLNLQCCTDIVFTHKILNKSIESQVCGRGQRIGRVGCLNIHYVMYENEIRYIRTR